MRSGSSSSSRRPPTTIKKWIDEATDTVWEICPLCKAYVKDVSYQGHGMYLADSLAAGVHTHIVAEHGMKRVRIGKRQRWLRVSPQH